MKRSDCDVGWCLSELRRLLPMRDSNFLVAYLTHWKLLDFGGPFCLQVPLAISTFKLRPMPISRCSPLQSTSSVQLAAATPTASCSACVAWLSSKISATCCHAFLSLWSKVMAYREVPLDTLPKVPPLSHPVVSSRPSTEVCRQILL